MICLLETLSRGQTLTIGLRIRRWLTYDLNHQTIRYRPDQEDE